MEKRVSVLTNIEVLEFKEEEKGHIIIGRDKNTGQGTKVNAEKILIAISRKSNTDLLKVQNAVVKTDEQRYIKVNEYLETIKKNIWAFGDVIGKYMFKHVANEEALVAWRNAVQYHKIPMDYSALPYALFTYPQIAAVDLSE